MNRPPACRQRKATSSSTRSPASIRRSPSSSSSTTWTSCSGSPTGCRCWCRDRSWSRDRRTRSPPITGAGRGAPGKSAMAEALAVERLRAGYGKMVVLEDVSFAARPGECLAVVGRNGVGKSTLLTTIMGHTTLHGGAIRLAGTEIHRLPIERRVEAGLGYVPQEREVFASLTVEENLAVAARPGEWTAERVYALFPNLAARRSNRGSQLSGGEQQMLAVGRALMGNPRVLLMDEPSEGLAPVIVESLRQAIAELARTTSLTVVLVEQNTRFALALAPRTLVMNRGRIVHDGPSAELAADGDALA